MKDFSKISDNKDIINKEYIDSYTVPVTKGGTGANSASGALTNLGLANAVTYEDTQQATEITPIPIAGGGTGATTAAAARANLGFGDLDYNVTDAEYNALIALATGTRLFDLIYPIGYVITTVNPNYDPNKIFKSQTWAPFAEGKTLVGVSEVDPQFDTHEKTGGEKTHTLTVAEMPAHEGHLYSNEGYSTGGTATYYLSRTVMSQYGSTGRGWVDYGNEMYPVGCTRGSDSAHNNLQPYITVYFWKRTA